MRLGGGALLLALLATPAFASCGARTSLDLPDASCPEPHPLPCDSIEECSCADGTKQIGGCPNGFTCAEACCGHEGVRAGP